MKDTIKTAMPTIIPRGPKTRVTESDAVTNEDGSRFHSGHSGLHSRVFSSQKKFSLHVRVQFPGVSVTRTHACTHIRIRLPLNSIHVAVTGRKRTLFHCMWANSISHNYL